MNTRIDLDQMPQVTDAASAERFVRWCCRTIGLAFHPDTDLKDYEEAASGRTFTDDEAARLEAQMTAVFVFVPDPYAIGLEEFEAMRGGPLPGQDATLPREHVETTFHVVLVSDAPDLAGRGSLPTAWESWGQPTDSIDMAQAVFAAAIAGAVRPIVALVEFAFTDLPAVGRRTSRVVRVAAWHGPLGLLPGVHPGGGFWDGMEVAACQAIVRLLGLS